MTTRCESLDNHVYSGPMQGDGRAYHSLQAYSSLSQHFFRLAVVAQNLLTRYWHEIAGSILVRQPLF